MRMLRFLTFLGISTILALFFVRNQINIYLLSYKLEKNNLLYEELLDENGILLYDINRLSSVQRISDKLGTSKDEFTIPMRIVRLEKEKKRLAERRENFFVRLFKLSPLAEAKEIKK